MTNHPRRWWNYWLLHNWGTWHRHGFTFNERVCEVCGRIQIKDAL